MAKNIVVCFDGTWNGVGVDSDRDDVPEDTNILKLYRLLEGETTAETRDLPDEEERFALDANGAPLQVAKYLHGVGDVANPIGRLFGGAFGAGIVKRIVRGYTFICRHYQPGDRIYLVGFSRGAYTARAVGGMIAKAGLMDYAKLGHPDKETAYQRGLYVWCYYRYGPGYTSPVSDEAQDTWTRLLQRSVEVGEEQMIPNVPIEAIGVFDTVGALGIPFYGKDDQRLDLFKFTDCVLSSKVRSGLHAVAIDEYRRDFVPTLWTPRDGVSQCWFVGAHADVGGGYEDARLSDLALQWLSAGLAARGLRVRAMSATGDASGEIHDPWDRFPYNRRPRQPRRVPVDATLHESVRDRQADPNAAGSPPGTPPPYQPAALQGWQGRIES